MLSIKTFGPATEAKAEPPCVFLDDWSLLVGFSRFLAYGKNAPITRHLLRECLTDPLYDAGKLKYGTAMDEYETLHPGTEKERVRNRLSNGANDDCDLIIGANDSYSKINRKSFGYIPKYLTIAAKCSLPANRFLSMSDNLVGGRMMCWADNKHIFSEYRW